MTLCPCVMVFQKRLTTAAKKAVSRMPQRTVRRGDAVSVVIICFQFVSYSLHAVLWIDKLIVLSCSCVSLSDVVTVAFNKQLLCNHGVLIIIINVKKTAIYTNVNGDIRWVTHRKLQKNHKRRCYLPSHCLNVNVLPSHITFYNFCGFWCVTRSMSPLTFL